MPDLIGRSLGPYRILEMIGRGGMAAIYKAYQPATDRLVAIKVLLDARAEDAGVVQRFEHEARIIAGLEHRNIVPVYDFGRDGDLLYLVMRYMRAGTVNDLLRSGPLAANDASSILSDVAAALDYAHALAIVHRDIKPNNILVDAEGHACLTDFGLAKVLGAGLDLTRSGGAPMGTPAYMAPEQVSGDPVSPQTDIYALGVMLYEMLTGALPFVSDSPMAVAMMHLSERLRPARELNPLISAEVEQVIERAMAKQPRDRFATAGGMAKSLTEAANEGDRGSSRRRDIDTSLQDYSITAAVSRPDSISSNDLLGAGQPTLDPNASPLKTTHLAQLARQVAETKSPEEVLPEIRRALRQQDAKRRRQRLLSFAPWVAAGLLIVALGIMLVAAVRGSAQSRASAAGTATALQALLGQLAAAQTALAAGGGPEVQATLAYLQTQIAGGSTPASTPSAAPSARSTSAPATATSQPPPSATPKPPSPTSILPGPVDTLVPKPGGIVPTLPGILP